MLSRTVFLAVLVAGAMTTSAIAQDAPLPSFQQLSGLDGALLFHGNYCGPGNRGTGKAPIDRLDVACRHHDMCTPQVGLPSCACDANLAREAAVAANDPREPSDVQALAGLASTSAQAIPCFE